MKCLECLGTGLMDFNLPPEPQYKTKCDRCGGTGEVDFYTQQQLIDKCTPEIIKKMVELAEGFECSEFELNTIFQIRYNSIALPYMDILLFPLLIHRAVEGFNKKDVEYQIRVDGDEVYIPTWELGESSCKYFKKATDYQPTTLTHVECAILDCLLEVLK